MSLEAPAVFLMCPVSKNSSSTCASRDKLPKYPLFAVICFSGCPFFVLKGKPSRTSTYFGGPSTSRIKATQADPLQHLHRVPVCTP